MSTTNQFFLSDPLEFSGSILINEPKKNLKRNQFIYSSNSYGTNYAIYAEFNCEDIKDDEDQIKLTIVLKLINYKGVINIGFAEENSTAEYIKEDKAIIIRTTVKGLASQKESEVKQVLIIPRKEFLTLTLDRTLIPLSDENAGVNSSVEDAFSGEVFDDNFYYREGNFFAVRNDFDSSDMIDSLKSKSTKIESKKAAMLMPGARCRVGKSQVYVF